jgi:hypothetical protein
LGLRNRRRLPLRWPACEQEQDYGPDAPCAMCRAGGLHGKFLRRLHESEASSRDVARSRSGFLHEGAVFPERSPASEGCRPNDGVIRTWQSG